MAALFDGWAHHPAPFRFPGLTEAQRSARAEAGALIGDPFAGSGRGATRSTGRGQRWQGIEAHPLLADLSSVKLSRPGPETELDAAVDWLCDDPQPARADLDAEHPAVTRLTDPQSLPTLVALRDRLQGRPGPWQGHLRWALLGAFRQATGPGWPYRRTGLAGRPASPQEVLRSVRTRAGRMADDLAVAPLRPAAELVVADSRLSSAWSGVQPDSWEAVVTSPPYLNQVSYLEATRLELLFLDPSATTADLRRSHGSGLLRSCTQQVTVPAANRAWEDLRERHAGVVETAWPLARALACERAARAQGKPYDRLLACYLADMSLVLSQQPRALAPGARAAWIIGDSAPYGVHVDTPALVSRLAVELGYEPVGDRKLRDRGQRWANGRRPARDLCERLVTFRRPASGAVQLPLPGL